MRPDGYVFHTYFKMGGREYERWLSPEASHRESVGIACCKARQRARDAGLPFDIDRDYLLSIFPSVGPCPVFNTPLVWGGAGRDNSPSLDRKNPALGYVRGNVAFISNRANRIKSDATSEEVLAVAKYLQG